MSEREILLVRHRVTVDGVVIYEGGDWGEHGRDVYRIVMDAITCPSHDVTHQILKQAVPLYSDPSTVRWQWTSKGDDHDSREC